jgi:hypothetical protein
VGDAITTGPVHPTRTEEQSMRSGKSRIRRVALLLGAVSALVLAATAPASAGITVTPNPHSSPIKALADPNCYPSDRICLTAYSNGYAPNIDHVTLHVVNNASTGWHDTAYPDAYGAQWMSVYTDVSTDGGRSWSPWVTSAQRSDPGWGWAGGPELTVKDGPNTWVRACAYKWDGRYLCTGWN